MAATGDFLYQKLLRPILFRLDPERAHRLALILLSTIPPSIGRADPPELRVSLWGIEFPNPVGLAAGMDKDARAVGGWQALGFGFAELGTVTPVPQSGNPLPRLWRLPRDRALMNTLGFPSEGMEAVARRLQRLRRHRLRIRLGLNLGPNKETAGAGAASAYCGLMSRLGPMADFVVLNLSSPNTPGLRRLQAPERIREIVEALREGVPEAVRRVPILIKIAPDLEPAELEAIGGNALEMGIAGIVATNTTVARHEVGVVSALAGGLSGSPLLGRARETIRRIRRSSGGRIPIIGVGGIFSAEDAYGHIRAGASLVELYTGMVYEGPLIVGRIKAGLLRLLRRDGFRSISEAVGNQV